MMTTITTPDWAEENVSENVSRFTITPLFPGYGHTVGNGLRRILLSSLPGAALTSVRFEGVTHEFSTLLGVKEDVVELTLNLKSIRLKVFSDEPVELSLAKKGPGVVTAGDFKASSSCEITTPEVVIAHLDKGGELYLTATAERGRGYQTVEQQATQTGLKMTLGTIALDANYSPVLHVEMTVQDTRVGQMTNYDRLALTVMTDGTVSPKDAFIQANDIFAEQVSAILAQANGEKPATRDEEEVARPTIVPDETMIGEAGLSPRVARLLEAAGYLTVGDVRRADEADISAVEGLGEKAQREVRLLRDQASAVQAAV